MNTITAQAYVSYEGSSTSIDRASDGASSDPFDALLDTVISETDEPYDDETTRDTRDDDPRAEDDRDDGAPRDDDDEVAQGATSAAATFAENLPRGITVVSRPERAFGPQSPAVQSLLAKMSALQTPDTAATPTAANLAAPNKAAGTGVDFQLTQQRAGVVSKPLSTLAGNTAMTDGTAQILTLRTNAQASAEKVFSTGRNVIERLSGRRADQQATATNSSASHAGTENGKTATSVDRLAGLSDQGLPRASDAQHASRPVTPATPTATGAMAASQAAARAGDITFTLPSSDSPNDVLNVGAQSASRGTASANATAQAAIRTPAPPSGTPAEQVSVQIRNGLRNDSDRISVRLTPAALGKVEVKLEVAPDKSVQAIVTAEKPETLDMLARDARTLQKALEEAGLQTNSNSLSFQREGGDSGNTNSSADNRGNRADGGPETRSGESDSETNTAMSDEAPVRRAAHDGMLDVEI